MNKIGLIAAAHPDYIADGHARNFASRAAEELRKGGVTVVYAGAPVTDAAAALDAALAVLREDCDGVILFFASWMECPTAMAALTELRHLPLMLWGVPMWRSEGREMSTGSYVSYAMFRGTAERVGLRFSEVLGMPEGEAVREALLFCRAAGAVKRLRRAKIGLVGYTSMSIYTGTFDHVLLRWKIGPEVEQSDSYSLIRRAEHFSIGQKREAEVLLRNEARCDDDIPPAMLEKAMGLYLAVEELKTERGYDAVNVKCQYEFSKEYG